MIFETERLILRKPDLNDAKDIFKNYAQDSDVVKYLTWTPHEKISTIQEFLKMAIASWDTGKAFPFVIHLKEAEEIIGMLDFRVDGFKADFGYALAKKYWNKGLMTEALIPVFNWIYNIPEIQRIWAVHDIDNPASGRVMKKLGMELEGTLRKWIIHPNISLIPRDCKVYARVK